MIDALRKRVRPGSTGEANSKVDTTGQRMATQAAVARSRTPGADTGVQNWPVGMMSDLTPQEKNEARAIPPHAPDDSEVLNRLFRLGVKDI